MYDAIVVGARVAGSPTAMLLARRGYRVLMIDRATFPSDTLSTHQVQVAGGALLKRWGLFDVVVATGCPPAHRLTFGMAGTTLRGEFPALDGVDAVIGPRRTVLDKILLDAAAAAGAEVRKGVTLVDLLTEDGRVVGIRGRTAAGTLVEERARIVVGADGRHSKVAEIVGPSSYDERPATSCGYYGYFEGVPLDGGEIYSLERRAFGVWPTNDGLTLVYVGAPIDEFPAFRVDPETAFLASLDLVPGLGERIRAGRRAEKLRGTADLPNYRRRPFGPGWALVGDAGYDRDPITALGISDAFRDADLLAEAIHAGFSGAAQLEAALAGYERERNRATKMPYETTLQLASFEPVPIEQLMMLDALTGNQAATNQFFGVMTGSVAPEAFFGPSNLLRVLGVSRMARIVLNRKRAGPRRAA